MFSDRLSENLLSFSDNIFIGGYVLTPNMEIETVVYDGAQYRRARYNELDGFDAGYVLHNAFAVRVCPKTSGGITKFSEHEAD